jgi:hypothetical protein
MQKNETPPLDKFHKSNLTIESSASEIEFRLADREAEFQERVDSLEKALEAKGTVSAGEVSPGLGELIRLIISVAKQVHLQGFVIIPEFLTSDQVQCLRDTLEEFFLLSRSIFERLNPEKPRQTFHIHNVLAKTRAIDQVMTNPLLRAIIKAILGPDFLLNAGAILMSPDPGCSPQGFHRDDTAYEFPPRPRLPLVVTVAIALDDFTKENGGTLLVPESCRWSGSRLPKKEEIVKCEMQAGSMLLWDGALFHAGGGNSTTNSRRRTLGINYSRGWLRTQFNQFLSIPRNVILSMPSALQNDLGYHRSLGGLGECDRQDALSYLKALVEKGGDGAQRSMGREFETSEQMARQ